MKHLLLILLLCTALFAAAQNLPNIKDGRHIDNGPPGQAMAETASVFVENRGQFADSDVRFRSWHSRSMEVYDDRITINGVGIGFKSISDGMTLSGERRQQHIFNYFGSGKSMPGIPSYGQVAYNDLWENIDLIFTAVENDRVEFQFIVRPGGDPNDIHLKVSGNDISIMQERNSLTVKKQGEELFTVSELRAFQGTRKIRVKPLVSRNPDTSYSLRYSVGDHDPAYAMVIDPVVVILSSSASDYAYEVRTAPSGDVYVSGSTGSSASFATATGSFGTLGSSDAFISKFDITLNTLVSTTILSSGNSDEAMGIAVDPDNGNVFVCGNTKDASDFGVSATVFGTPAVNEKNGFVCKLSSDLGTLYATTIVCSNEKDEAQSVAVGYDSNIFMTGQAGNDGAFACSGCPEKVFYGNSDGDVEAYVTKLSNDLSTHIRTAMLTSDAEDEAYVIAFDSNNNVFIAGRTKNYDDFADSHEYYGGQPTIKIGYSAFVIKFDYNLNLQKTGILASEVVSDVIRAMVIDANGNVFVGGLTEDSGSFPKNPKYYYGNTGSIGDPDGFVVRLSNNLNYHSATAIVSSSDKDKVYGLALDADQNIIIGGYTKGPSDFGQNATVDGGTGNEDAFIMKLSNSLSSHISTDVYSSYATDIIYEIDVGYDGGIFAAGETGASQNLTASSASTLYGTAGGDSDGFLLKIGGLVTGTEDASGELSEQEVMSMTDRCELLITLKEPGYVGYNAYSVDGRLLTMESLGYLPQGTYRLPLDLNYNGIVILNVRMGNSTRGIKHLCR